MKRRWQIVVAVAGFSLAVDFAVAYLAFHWSKNEFTDPTVVWVWFGLIVAAQFVCGVYGEIKRFILYLIYKDEGGRRWLARKLDREGFPTPRAYHAADSYLADIVDQDGYPEELRKRASFYRGEIAGYQQGANFVSGIRFLHTWDEAIKILASDKNIRKPD